MGGSSKKQTVGYKYHIGMHTVLCHGVLDKMVRLRCDAKEVWSYLNQTDQADIDLPDIFGGESREGGIVGRISFDKGEPTQQANTYLDTILGDSVPAFRGVVGAIFESLYIGMNPYLKKWEYRLQRVFRTSDDEEQWYSPKAGIGYISNSAIYISLDNSSSMLGNTGNGLNRLQNMQIAIKLALAPLSVVQAKDKVDIMIVSFGTLAGTTNILKRDLDGETDLQDLFDFIDAMVGDQGQTDFDAAVSEAVEFFDNSDNKRRASIFITDGGPAPSGSYLTAGVTLLGIENIDAYGFNIDLVDTQYTAHLDNTPQDGVPVILGDDSEALAAAVEVAVFSFYDMNPAHIIRECLTDKNWGLGYEETFIDDTSFTKAADTLHDDEALGMSLLWSTQESISDFVDRVKKHINAELFVDRGTGLFNLVLIRDDYVKSSLPVLDESNIQKITDFKVPSLNELVNAVSVKYYDLGVAETGTVTVQDVAMIQQYGEVIATTVDYSGFSNIETAAKAAQRDLKSLSTPLVSCVLSVTDLSLSFNLGDVFVLNWEEYNVLQLVMRVTEVNYGDGKSNTIRVKCVEDVFSQPTKSVVADSEVLWVDPSSEPVPIVNQIAFELPYFELVQLESQAQVENILATNPSAGHIGAAASRPATGINSIMSTDSGAGFTEVGVLDFCPSAALGFDINKTQKTINLIDINTLNEVPLGTWFQIGDELLSLESAPDGGGNVDVKRGLLDTVPESHLAFDILLFWDEWSQIDPIQYVASDVVDVRLSNVSPIGVSDLDDSLESTVTFDSRAIRPYPAGNLKIQGENFPDSVSGEDMIVTWASRNRLLQTSGVLLDYFSDSVTPEVGITYNVYLKQGESIIDSALGLTALTTTFSGNIEGSYTLLVDTLRDGYINFIPLTHDFEYYPAIKPASITSDEAFGIATVANI